MKKLYLISILFFISFTNFSQNSEIELYIKANVHLKEGKIDKAISYLQEIISTESKDSKIYMRLGDCYKNKKDYDNAIENYSKAILLKNYFGFYKIAECYSLDNEARKSTDYLKEYLQTKNKLLVQDIKLNPDFKNIEQTQEWKQLWKTEYYNNYEKKLSEAEYLISSKKYTEAFELLDNLLYKNNKRYRAIEIRADLLMLIKDYKNAAKEYSKASDIKKKNILYKEKAAEAYYKSGKSKISLEIYNDIYSRKPYRIDILLKKSEIEYSLKKIEDAFFSVNEYLKYHPKDSKALHLSAKIYNEKNNYISALEQYNICIENDKTQIQYFIERADILSELNQFDDAIYDYSMALDLDPSIGEIYYKRGLTYLNKYDYKNACLDFKKAGNLNFHKSDDYMIKYCK